MSDKSTSVSKEIVEGNRVISVYMDLVYDQLSDSHRKLLAPWIVTTPEGLEYNTSWNVLMKVIDDIYYSRRFDTGVQSSEISSKPVRLYANIKAALLNLSIQQTWRAVVQFIQWYNSQKTIDHG